MAAIRCAARRLGGSLLQRTQAAVAEEGRLLAPSRLMRSRHLSTQVSGERSQVPERLLLEPGLIMRNHQLASEITKRLQEPSAEEYEVQCRMEALVAKWDKLAELHKEELEKSAPDAFELGVKAYGNAAKSVVRVAAKSLMYFCMICSVILGDK